MGILGLAHVQLAAPPGSEHEARQFFGGLLGLTEIEKPEPLRERGGVWFALGDQQLHIGVTPDFSPATKAHPALRVAAGELEDVAARLTQAGSEIVWDSTLPGQSRFYTDDPWGNRLELLADT
jgi:hypothetical protein